MKISAQLLSAIFYVSVSAFAAVPTAYAGDIAASATAEATKDIGPHEPVMIFKKSLNPQNLTRIYTKVNPDCSFQEAGGHPVFDFYWLMDGSRYKPMNSLIKNEIFKRLDAQPAQSPNSFFVSFNDLKEVVTDIPEKNWRIDIRSSKNGDGCEVKAFMTLGPSNQNARIQLSQVYSDASVNKFTRSVHVKSLTLTGVNAKTGEKITQTYPGRQ